MKLKEKVVEEKRRYIPLFILDFFWVLSLFFECPFSRYRFVSDLLFGGQEFSNVFFSSSLIGGEKKAGKETRDYSLPICRESCDILEIIEWSFDSE